MADKHHLFHRAEKSSLIQLTSSKLNTDLKSKYTLNLKNMVETYRFSYAY